MKIEYTKDNTRVYDSYKYNSKEIKQAVQDIIDARKELGLSVTRTKQSYISEWKAHNRLYKLGIEVHRTKDVDLEEDINPIRNFLYLIMGL